MRADAIGRTYCVLLRLQFFGERRWEWWTPVGDGPGEYAFIGDSYALCHQGDPQGQCRLYSECHGYAFNEVPKLTSKGPVVCCEITTRGTCLAVVVCAYACASVCG